MKLSAILSAGAAAVVVIADYMIVVSDCVTAGRVLGEASLGAMNLLMPLFALVAFSAWFLAFGTAEVCLRQYKREGEDGAVRVARRGFVLMAIAAVLHVVLLQSCEEFYLAFMGVPEVVAEEVRKFWCDYRFVIPVQFLYMLSFYLVYKRGHERTCLTSYGILMVVNAAVSYHLAERFGIRGIALGTIIALIASLFVLLPRLEFFFRDLDWEVRVDWRQWLRPLKFALPHAAGWFFQAIVFLIITKTVLTIWDSDSLPILAVTFCTIRLTGFFCGLGIAFRSHERGPVNVRVFRIASASAFIVMIVVTALLFLAPELVAGLFGIVSPDLVEGARFALRITVYGLIITGVIAYLPLHFRLRTMKFPQAPVNYLQGYILDLIEDKPSTQMFNLAKFFRLRKGVDLEKLADALVKSAESHAAVWTTFSQDGSGEIVQRRSLSFKSFKFPIYRDVNEEELLAKKADLVKSFKPFGGRLFDAAIYDCGERAYLLSNFHHLICDGYSFPVILEDARKVYHDETLEPDSYYEILRKRAEKSMTPLAEASRTLLRETLKERSFTTLPKPDSDDKPGYGAEEFPLTLPEGFEEFLAQRRVTRHHVFLAATVMALKRLTEAKDVLVDWVFHGRLSKDELKTVGAFMVDLPLIVENCDDMTAHDLLAHIKRTTFNGIKNVNVIRDITDCNPDGEERLTFIYQDEWGELMSPGPVRGDGPYAWMIEETISLTPPKAATENPFNVEIMEHKDSTRLYIEYDVGRYALSTVKRYAELFVEALNDLLRTASI